MKKIPITVIPIVVLIVIVLLFTFYVPKDGDLISAKGDFVLGAMTSTLFIACVLVDIIRFIRNK
jgi:uncharacterized sodium:solute symporter family permease YidK